MSTIECAICFLQYDEEERTPRILTSCGHTVCQQCALQFLRYGRTMTCPFDRKVTQMGRNEGVNGLPKNFALLELSRKANQEQEKKSETQTDVPCFEDPSHEAVFYCQQCEVELCDSCFTSVHKSKTHSTHQKINISERPIKLPKCPKHPHNIAEFFCSDPQCTNSTKIMCPTCILLGQHKSHKYDCLMEKLVENKQNLEQAVDAQKMLQEYEEMQTKIANQVLASYDITGEEFKNAVKVISDQFDMKKREAICKLTQFANEKREEKMELLRGVEKKWSKMKEFDDLLETLKITKNLQVKDEIENWKRSIPLSYDSPIESRCLKDHEFIVSNMKLEILKSNLSLQPIMETFKKDMDRKYSHINL